MADPQKHRLDMGDYVKEVAGIQKIMADEKEMTDVILLCGEKKIPAHKLILAGASPYFRTMFRNECKETVENVVELPTVTENTLTIILDFIYDIGSKEICWKSEEETVDVLEAAHLFEMKPLFIICCRQLVKNLTRENCLQFWKLGNLYEDEFFRSQSFQFVKNNLDELVKDETLLQMDASDFKLLVTQMKVATLPQECFMNSVSDWILENRAERQSLIPLLSVNNLSKEAIESFLEKNELSQMNIEFLKQLRNTDRQADQYYELDVPLSSFKILLYGEVGDQLAYQIVDFSGRSSKVKTLLLNGKEFIVGAVYKTSFYFMIKEFPGKSPLYECCLLSGKLFLHKIWEIKYMTKIEKCIVLEDFLYVLGTSPDYLGGTWKLFLRCYDILTKTWEDLTHLIKKFKAIHFSFQISAGFFLVSWNDQSFDFIFIYKKKEKKNMPFICLDLPLPTRFTMTSACFYDGQLFLFSSDNRMVVYTVIDNSMDLRFNPFINPGNHLYFPGFKSQVVAVEKNPSTSKGEASSHLLKCIKSGEENSMVVKDVRKIPSTQINLDNYYGQTLFVSDMSI